MSAWPQPGRRDRVLRKFTWVGNQITDEDMTKLYQIKKARRVPITKLVATAVREFIKKTEKEGTNVQKS